MYYVIVLGILALLWVINILAGIPVAKSLTNESVFFKKIVSNGNNIFFCSFGVAGIAIAYYLWEPFKWVVMAYEIIFGIILLFLLISSLVGRIIITFDYIKLPKIERDEIKLECKNQDFIFYSEVDHPILWFVILSNFLDVLSMAVVAYACWWLMF